MYFYTQRWSDHAGTWLVEGDEYTDLTRAQVELEEMRADHPEQPEDDFRITVYLTPLSQKNESMRMAC